MQKKNEKRASFYYVLWLLILIGTSATIIYNKSWIIVFLGALITGAAVMFLLAERIGRTQFNEAGKRMEKIITDISQQE